MSVTGILKLKSAIKFFTTMRDELPSRGVERVLTLESIFRQRVVDFAPSRVGGLKGSITSGSGNLIQIGGNAAYFFVETSSPQAFFVEFGTGLYNTFPGASQGMIVKRGKGVFKASEESFFEGPAVNNGPSQGIHIPFEPGGIYPKFNLPSTRSPSNSYIYFKKHRGQKPNPFFFRVLEEGHTEPEEAFMEIASKFGFD